MLKKKSLLFNIAVLIGLSSLFVYARSLSDFGRSQKDYQIRSGDWIYRVRFTNPGTRSEGMHGTLFYKNNRFINRFHSIWIPLGRFDFWQGKHLWGNHGWVRSSKIPVKKAAQHTAMITTAALKQGWYRGQKPRKGTPPDWIRVKRDKSWWWVKPARAAALAGQQQWSELHANLFMLKKR